MRKLGYDEYRALRAKPDTALWRNAKGLFRVEFFPAGFIYEKPVSIGIVENGNVTPVIVGSGQFDFSDTGLKEPPKDIALAGFKITYPLNRPDKFDEVISFLGASYFRPIGRGQGYGSSARGLAVDTATERPEEFPTFRSFWLVKPADDANELDGLGIARFARRGRRLRLRHPPGRADGRGDQGRPLHPPRRLAAGDRAADLDVLRRQGLAARATTIGPEIHDADGLFMLTGKGERIWRPLANPGGARRFVVRRHQSRAASACCSASGRSPSIRTAAPASKRGRACGSSPRAIGATARCGWSRSRRSPETNDNIVAFWVVALAGQAGKPTRIQLPPVRPGRRGRAVAARARRGDARSGAIPNNDKARRVVVEFAGGDLSTLRPEQPVEAHVSLAQRQAAAQLRRSAAVAKELAPLHRLRARRKEAGRHARHPRPARRPR